MTRVTVLRRLLVAIIAAGVLQLTGGSSGASAPALTVDQPMREVVRQEHVIAFPSDNNCTGMPRQMTIRYNAVFNMGQDSHDQGHSRYWSALTQTGKFTLEPSAPGEPSYTGRFGLIAGEPDARHVGTEVLILQLTGTGSDGSAFRARLFEHVRVTNSGFDISLVTPVMQLDRLMCS